MEKLKCPICNNSKSFYKKVHLVGKVNVLSTGKRGKRIYNIQEEEDYEPLYCSKCENVVEESFYCN